MPLVHSTDRNHTRGSKLRDGNFELPETPTANHHFNNSTLWHMMLANDLQTGIFVC